MVKFGDALDKIDKGTQVYCPLCGCPDNTVYQSEGEVTDDYSKLHKFTCIVCARPIEFKIKWYCFTSS